MRTIAYLFIGVCATISILVFTTTMFAANRISRQLKEQQAMTCAIQSEGTDQAIADCFTKLGLPCPDDICPK
jgi:hypothetical protein